MNLINKNTPDFDLINYREYQYNMILEFIDICIEYLSRFGHKFENIIIKHNNIISYKSNNHYELTNLKIKPKNSSIHILDIDIPTLLNGMFFKLNGSYYVPMIYILDKPIVFKKNSITIQSLFKTFHIIKNDNIFMIDNRRIELEYFEEFFNNDFKNLNKISSFLNCEDDDILNKLNMLFFDNWTKELFIKIYNINSFDQIFKYVMNNNIIIEFNDLNYKRLQFIEMLLMPIFDSIKMYIHSPNPQQKLQIKTNTIIQYFFSSGHSSNLKNNQFSKPGLMGNSLYTPVNGFTGLIGLKASFKNPRNKSMLPLSISKIHETHKGKICPITISSKEPGTMVSMIQDQKIDKRYGLLL